MSILNHKIEDAFVFKLGTSIENVVMDSLVIQVFPSNNQNYFTSKTGYVFCENQTGFYAEPIDDVSFECM